MSEIKLKNCPFCGSEVELEDIGEDSNDHYYMIACKNSSCGSSTCFGEVSKEDFISVWNTRKPIDTMVEKVEKELEELKEWEDVDGKAYYTMSEKQVINKAIKIVKRGGIDE